MYVSAHSCIGTKQVAYKARFVPYESNIIGDRLFTTKVPSRSCIHSTPSEEFRVIRVVANCNVKQSLVESTMGHNIVSNCSWSPQQPNRLTLELNSGIKVCHSRAEQHVLKTCLKYLRLYFCALAYCRSKIWSLRGLLACQLQANLIPPSILSRLNLVLFEELLGTLNLSINITLCDARSVFQVFDYRRGGPPSVKVNCYVLPQD